MRQRQRGAPPSGGGRSAAKTATAEATSRAARAAVFSTSARAWALVPTTPTDAIANALQAFRIGYAPDAWQPLAAVFSRYDDVALETVGLVIAGDGGKRYDRFRDRIMFPIRSVRGEIIGFGGRVLDRGEPKYMNSPETPLFSKGRELYGLYQARRAIRDAGRVLALRSFGKAAFLKVRDRSGELQIWVKKDKLGHLLSSL